MAQICIVVGACSMSHILSSAEAAGTVAGIGGVLRATAVRKRTRVQSRSRSRSPHRAGGEEQSEQDHSTGDDGVDDQSGEIISTHAYLQQVLRLRPEVHHAQVTS